MHKVERGSIIASEEKEGIVRLCGNGFVRGDAVIL